MTDTASEAISKTLSSMMSSSDSSSSDSQQSLSSGSEVRAGVSVSVWGVLAQASGADLEL